MSCAVWYRDPLGPVQGEVQSVHSSIAQSGWYLILPHQFLNYFLFHFAVVGSCIQMGEAALPWAWGLEGFGWSVAMLTYMLGVFSNHINARIQDFLTKHCFITRSSVLYIALTVVLMSWLINV